MYLGFKDTTVLHFKHKQPSAETGSATQPPPPLRFFQ
jgi:hypothetical protein